MRSTRQVFVLSPQQRLAPPDDQVVQQHGADHGKNHAEIELADPAHGYAAGIGGEGRVHVDLAESEFFSHARMALAAGFHEIGVVDGGARVAGGQDVVHAVATRAIGHDLGAKLRRQAVIARQIGGGTATFTPNSSIEPHAFMAAGAGNAGQVRRG